jgi:ABC-type sugar transport system permease subunit
VFPSVLTALGVGLLAAVAVDQGFGPGFIDNVVAYPAVIYSAAVAATVARWRANASGGGRAWFLNVVSHACVSAVMLVLLRTLLRFELPIGTFTTTGHYPYVAIPLTCVAAQVVWDLMGKRMTNRAPEVNV